MGIPRRVIAYVDGYNLYYGTKSAGFQRFLWLNLRDLISHFLEYNQTLAATKYFTSRVSSPPDSVRRQSQYIDAISHFGVEIIEGRHGTDQEVCICGRKYASRSEKMTDVNIALSITRDAFSNNFDTAFLVTGDSDQVPTIQLIKDLFPAKAIGVLFPPQRSSRHLKSIAHFCLNINQNHLRNSQLPPVISLPNGSSISRPAKWT